MIVLALNSGSSSLKFGIYRAGPAAVDMLVAGEAEMIGEAQGKLSAHDAKRRTLVSETAAIANQQAAIERIGRLLAAIDIPAPEAVGHRIVHGGPALRRHCLIDAAVMHQLEAAAAFAPLHVPVALSLVRHAMAQFPGLPQVACFDTSFHADLPELARVLPVPSELRAQGIERYGFHGLSCESIVRQLGGDLPQRTVIAHLGHGASVTAVRDGHSVDTSMGLTPTGGVVMSTRTGDLDPGVLVYLMREKKLDAAQLEALVNERAGLLGISGVSGDMRRLREAAASNAQARLAVEMFCYSVRKQVAAMATAMEGVDLLVFTGGIGENDAETRAAICAGLSWAGVGLDAERNRSARNPLHDIGSHCAVLVLPARENEEIARHTASLPSLAIQFSR
ncbi:acetate/propionate family kinase [Variovorax sp. PBL-E5]|uniref:acetate/propionate family kinase n=1 Tax=Variovorax sp. PBL-E5 TaxID=434014 RepID=UPI0013160B0B|nr:acetate/propionate family kinase [Variovorax sp. PBL-E5]VTU22249.1 Acetate kinase [Variovorax sp. PBL-E5]